MPKRIEMAKKMLGSGQVSRVIGWRKGDLFYHSEPAVFKTEEALGNLIYDSFCGANLCKYLIEARRQGGRTLIFLKPCDTYGYNQLLKEHQISRVDTYIVGVACNGKLDIEKIRKKSPKGIQNIEEDEIYIKIKAVEGDISIEKDHVLLDKCLVCKGCANLDFDSPPPLDEGMREPAQKDSRFLCVSEIEAMAPEEKFIFWQKSLSNCIRCNACRNVCPVCTCRTCVFDGDAFDSSAKVSAVAFEEKLFHIIRAYHVAGKCTDCGECGRVCPQHIPLHLLNRKLIKDINAYFGEYQAGEDSEAIGPLQSFTLEDIEVEEAVNVGKERG